MPLKYSFKDLTGTLVDSTASFGVANYAQPITLSFTYREAETNTRWYVEATGTRVQVTPECTTIQVTQEEPQIAPKV